MMNMIAPPGAAGPWRAATDRGSEPAPVSPEFVEQVMLLVSELVTNGVGHGNRPGGASMELSLGVEPHGIRLKMHDPEPSFEATRPGSVWFETVRSRPECQGSRPSEEQTARMELVGLRRRGRDGGPTAHTEPSVW